MTMENLLLVFILFGTFQSFLLSIYFIYLDSYENPTKLLYICFLIISIIFLLGLFYSLEHHFQYPHLSRVGLPIGALIAPTFALGSEKNFGYPQDKIFWRILYFAIPICSFIYLIPFYSLNSNEKLTLILNTQSILDKDCVYLNLLSICSNFIIFLRMYYRLKFISLEFNPKLIENIIEFKKLNLWCLYLICISFIIFILKPIPESESFINVLFSSWVLIFAWNQVYLKTIHKNPTTMPPSEIKYSKSLMDHDLLNRYGKQIEDYLMIKENITNPNLNLDSISKHLGPSLNLTSQVINRYFSKTLLEVVRQFRINLAKDMLSDSEFSVLRIGLEIGYNSKSSFLRSFREETGTTPSLFRRNVLQKNYKKKYDINS